MMQKHTINFLKYWGYDVSDFIPCMVCGCKAVDLHHIRPRSFFGKKTKHLQDDPINIIALCRKHHEDAHGDILTKVELTELVKTAIRIRDIRNPQGIHSKQPLI